MPFICPGVREEAIRVTALMPTYSRLCTPADTAIKPPGVSPFIRVAGMDTPFETHRVKRFLYPLIKDLLYI